MKNLSSYCGLVDAKIRASNKDLPVNKWIDFKLGLAAAATFTSLLCMKVKMKLIRLDEHLSAYLTFSKNTFGWIISRS